jgi:hypothetical protein
MDEEIMDMRVFKMKAVAMIRTSDLLEVDEHNIKNG